MFQLLILQRGMVGKEAFELMKNGTVIINCARDILVDEEELKAIDAGKVKKYVTDFANPTVVNKDNIIILPHLGASTEEAEDNCAIMAVNEIRDFIENGNIVNSVNYPACSMGVCASEGRITICHKNVPTVLSKITSVMGEAGVNISDMTNKSRNDYALIQSLILIQQEMQILSRSLKLLKALSEQELLSNLN